MRKIGIVTAIWTAMCLNAATRTPDEAITIASSFLNYQPSSTKGARRAPAKPEVVASSEAYYAVNTGGGYVVVAADDRLPDVLGYSDSGTFEPDNMSPAMRDWLDGYDEELAQINNLSSAISNGPLRSISATNKLMTSTWNQSAPYNNLAPAYNETGSQCVTGCVATAMAQIMYYHRHPAQGTGSHSYLWVCSDPVGQSATLSANFGNTTYDWDNMLDSYRSGYTQAQADAVATLMYHCGVSIDMGYGQSSGAYTQDVPSALKTYFGYDANYQRIQKVMYPADSLNAIIAAELAANRPVLVSGSNSEGGHAFVCDGCDTRGYFHINWGWGGSNDGYYLLTALNPGKSQGIGGTTQGYNKGTSFFIGLRPAASGTPKAIPQMATTTISTSVTEVNRGTSFTVSIARLQNYGLTNFSGSYGIALYDEDETQLVRVLNQVDNYSLSANHYRTTAATVSVSIPNNIDNGTYHLCAVYKDANYDWMRLLCTEDDYYKTIELTSTKATFHANDEEPALALTKSISFGEGVNTDSIPFTGAPLSFSVKNTGGTFRGQISARIYQGSRTRGQYELVDSVVIRRNQSLNSALQQEFQGTLQIGTQYTMKLCWRVDENDSWHDFTPSEYYELPFKLVKCVDEYEYSAVVCEEQTTYSGYGFTIAEADMPTPGSSKEFFRNGKNNDINECDSLFSLMLTVTANDTTNVPVTIDNTQLPYEVDAYYTVPANAQIGTPFEVVKKTGDCAYKRYTVTISQCTAPYNYSADLCSNQTSYSGYGFNIATADLPTPGNSKQFNRNAMNAQGCDSVITLTLTMHAVKNTALSDAICEDETSYSGNDFTIAKSDWPAVGQSKVFTRTLTSAENCDSIVSLTLTVTKADTTTIQVEKLNTELPCVVDEYYTVPANATIGTPFEVVKKAGECAYNRYTVTISQCTAPYNYSADLCSNQTSYSGNGFNIATADLPTPGNSKQFNRNAMNAQGCDSVITLTLTMHAVKSTALSDAICEDETSYSGNDFTIAKSDWPAVGQSKVFTRTLTSAENCDSIVSLTLTVTKADTTDVPVAIENTHLPYEVDAYYTVPANATIGSPFEVVKKTGDCAYNRYLVSISQKPDDPPTGIGNLAEPFNGEAERTLLMRTGAYDLYLETVRSGNDVQYRKVFVPAQ